MKGKTISAALMAIALSLVAVAGTAQQRKTAELDIAGKRFVPAESTAKIPVALAREDPSVLMAVRSGDSIVIRNKDNIYWKPFSYSPWNKFELNSQQGLGPGQYTVITAKNLTNKPIKLTIFDSIHSTAKITIVVLPSNAKLTAAEHTSFKGAQQAAKRASETLTNVADFSGNWHAGVGEFNDPLDSFELRQNGADVTGTYSYRKQGGSLTGTVTGRTLKFNWTWYGEKSNGEITLSDDGKGFSGWYDAPNLYHNAFQAGKQ